MKIIEYEVKLKNKSFGRFKTYTEAYDKLIEIKKDIHQQGIYKIYQTKEDGERVAIFNFTIM